MTNQQFNQQSSGNQSSAEIALAKRFYSFHTLPKEIQEKLLRLQNTKGDFLRLRFDDTGGWFFLILALVAFAFFVFIIVSTRIIYPRTVGLVFGSAIFLIWIAYFGWRLYKLKSMPIKNGIYLTPTQLIQTLDGYVRYRELRDVIEITSQTFGGKMSDTYVLSFKLNDNDSFAYNFPLSKTTEASFQRCTEEANSWTDKAIMWRNYSTKAFQNGDVAYFNKLNIFQGLSETNTPVVKRKSGVLPVMILLLISFSLAVIGFIAYNYVISN